MTLDTLNTSLITLLTRVGSNRITGTDILTASQNIVNYFATQIASIIPEWTAVLTFQTDGTDAGKYCKYDDTNGKKRIFETKTDDNINHLPPTDPGITENTYWIEVSASASSSIKEWAAGVYGSELVIVYHNHSVDGPGLYLLTEATRPFASTNIETETSAQKWERLDANYVAITKTAHGFVANDVLTFKSAAWNKYAAGDNWLGFVRHVVSANVVLVYLRGQRIRGLSGLTPGSIYYAQDNATISTTVAGDALFMAISATEAILF